MRRYSASVFLFLLISLPLTLFAASAIQERADRFLKLTNAGYQALYRVNSEAQWLAVTDVKPEHDAAAEATGKAYAAFNGNPLASKKSTSAREASMSASTNVASAIALLQIVR